MPFQINKCSLRKFFVNLVTVAKFDGSFVAPYPSMPFSKLNMYPLGKLSVALIMHAVMFLWKLCGD